MTKPELIERPAYDGPHWIEDETARNPYCVRGDVVFVKLTRGMCAICDLSSWHLVRDRRWCASHGGDMVFYAQSGKTNRLEYARMHWLVSGHGPRARVDHANQDSLDNRASNLRPCNAIQNARNRRRRRDNCSGFIGVGEFRGKWLARIRRNRKLVYCETFDQPELAARARDRKAIELHGEFASLNFPRSDYCPAITP